MDYDFIEDYCLAKRGVVKEFKPDWDAILYRVGDKIFALVWNNKEGEPVISMKHTAEHGAELREQYDDITPGYHLNKVLWSSVLLLGNTPVDVVKGMLDESYDIVFASLTKKVQAGIMSL